MNRLSILAICLFNLNAHAAVWYQAIKPHHVVAIPSIELSPDTRALLSKRLHKPITKLTDDLPSKSILAMNEVPVLDQGKYGSCVSFALTAAIDAQIGHGDEISPLCLLSLGNYLEQHGYQKSGWQGAWVDLIFARLKEFGYIDIVSQIQYGCAGLHQYSLLDTAVPKNAMPPEDYHRLSHPISSRLKLQELLNYQEFLYHEHSPEEILYRSKNALAHGQRILLAVLIPARPLVGLNGRNHQNNDTWLLDDELKEYYAHNRKWGAHEMLITGYDDDIIVTDANGKTHQGMFILRNSWGEDAGDHGNFYMSYEYLANLGIELKAVHT